eukprot:TRINITY_DN812_c0_g1_i2.p1 TRINITY_DN812_c0_g1~~TRINITY_DN812_c0_g1_i2.p1  ORF type:complete len:252 (-),score=99.71 TRINITY_DN812_c0_g1_i2:63-818(-)
MQDEAEAEMERIDALIKAEDAKTKKKEDEKDGRNAKASAGPMDVRKSHMQSYPTAAYGHENHGHGIGCPSVNVYPQYAGYYDMHGNYHVMDERYFSQLDQYGKIPNAPPPPPPPPPPPGSTFPPPPPPPGVTKMDDSQKQDEHVKVTPAMDGLGGWETVRTVTRVEDDDEDDDEEHKMSGPIGSKRERMVIEDDEQDDDDGDGDGAGIGMAEHESVNLGKKKQIVVEFNRKRISGSRAIMIKKRRERKLGL